MRRPFPNSPLSVRIQKKTIYLAGSGYRKATSMRPGTITQQRYLDDDYIKGMKVLTQ